MTGILAQIIAHKQMEVATLDATSLRAAAADAPPARDFLAALKGTDPEHPALIAELKRASPSKGLLAPHLDLFQVADIYTRNGASAISVLTDEKFFLGKLGTLRDLRYTQRTSLPLLRKDFTIAEAQIYEARANGADAVLLIAAALPDDGLFAELHACARALGMTALVEVHDESETIRALRLKNIALIGINNRNLSSFEVSLATTESLRAYIPGGISVVSESGIFTGQDVARLARANVDAVLVGEALVTAPDIAAKVRELSGMAA
jgi:indole-3-glycerol phosphate synthase